MSECHVHLHLPGLEALRDQLARIEDSMSKSSELADRLAAVLPGLQADVAFLKAQALKNPDATEADLDRISNIVTKFEALDAETVPVAPEAVADLVAGAAAAVTAAATPETDLKASIVAGLAEAATQTVALLEDPDLTIAEKVAAVEAGRAQHDAVADAMIAGTEG